jgi:hypothetical protein
MANIALNKPSGGQLILSPEDGTSTETVTIPSVGVGKVLQVVQAKGSTGRQIYTSSSYLTILSASITPSSATSKILVSVHSSATRTSNGYINSRIYCSTNGTMPLAIDTQTAYLAGSTAEHSVGSISGEALDSPNTASAITYELQVAIANGASMFVDGQPVITLMEVAA